MISGGNDTSNITLTWVVYLILRNRLVLKKIKAELDIHIRKEKWVTESDISKLTYLQVVVKETSRLYPLAPLSGSHKFTENCTLSGYNIKKGTRLITNL